MEDAFKEVNEGEIAERPTDGVLVIVLAPAALDQGEEVEDDQRHAERQRENFVEKTVFLLSFLGEAKPNEIADGHKTADQRQPIEDGFLPVLDYDDFEDVEDSQNNKDNGEEKELTAINQLGLCQVVHFFLFFFHEHNSKVKALLKQ